MASRLNRADVQTTSRGDENVAWTCVTCTVHGNPAQFLACRVCQTPRSSSQHHATVISLLDSDNDNDHSSETRSNVVEQPSIAGARRSDRAEEEDVWKDNDNNDSSSSTNQKPAAKQNKRKRTAEPPDVDSINTNHNIYTENDELRRPPRHTTAIHNLSDRRYCMVWNVEVLEGGYRPDVARELLARVARHVNPILRERGWRVKRLMESASRRFLGCCTTNGRDDADAASVNIQLNLRTQPHKRCTKFFSFRRVLQVMLHEITHTSIGLEDIHPPAFWELLAEIKVQYQSLKQQGKVADEYQNSDCDYGCCSELYTTANGHVLPIQEAAEDVLGQDPIRHHDPKSGDKNSTQAKDDIGNTDEGNRDNEANQCGVKKGRRQRRRRPQSQRARHSSNRSEPRRPLLKGARMVDGRTKAGKASKLEREHLTAQQLAARAALARLGCDAQTKLPKEEDTVELLSLDRESSGDDDDSVNKTTNKRVRNHQQDSGIDYDEDSDDDSVTIVPHISTCACQSCQWDRLLS